MRSLDPIISGNNRFANTANQLHKRTLMLQEASSPINAILTEYGVCILESHHAHDFRMNWTRHPFLKIISVINDEGALETNVGTTRIARETSPLFLKTKSID
ncbi:MAG: hypothetical protein P8L49_13615 [Opitutaceae bacterium]|nr:hypothetical protein [Opitutaceae bacterium]